MSRRFATVWCALSMCASELHAQGSLQQCVEAFARAAGAAQPGLVVEPPRFEFLLTTDARTHPVSFGRADCYGFLAVGSRYVQQVSVVVQDAQGQVLAAPAAADSTPYVVYCGRRGERVFVTLRADDGQGEVAYVALRHAPVHLPARPVLAGCRAVGQPRPAAIDVGPEPQGRSIAEELASLGDELASFGYVPDRMGGYGVLAERQREARGLQLAGPRCYALAAVGSRDVADLDLRVFEPTTSLLPFASDTTRRRTALIKLCTDAERRYVLDVAAFQGQGAYALAIFALQEPAPRPPGIVGGARGGYAELSSRLRARGLRTEVVTTGVVRPGEQLSVPVSLLAEQCAAFAAVSAKRPGSVELALLTERSEVVAFDARASEDPLLFHCASSEARYRAVVRPRDAHAPTRFVLLRGVDAAPAPPGGP